MARHHRVGDRGSDTHYCCFLSLFLQPRRARRNTGRHSCRRLSDDMNTSGVPVITALSLMTFAFLAMSCPAAAGGLVPVGAPFSCGATARGAGRFRTSPAGPALCPALAFQGRSCNCIDLLKNIDLSRSTRHGRKKTIFLDVHLSLGRKQVFVKPCAKQHALWVDPRRV